MRISDWSSDVCSSDLALQLGRPLHEFLGLARGVRHHLDLAVTLDGEAFHRLAGLANAVDHAAGPLRLDAADDDRGDVGALAGADQGAEVQLEVLAELQAPIVVRQREGSEEHTSELQSLMRTSYAVF